MSGSVHERIAAAREVLVRAGLTPADAAIDAEVLARHALRWDRGTLLAHGREPAPDDFSADYAELIRRRATREPVALITGHREFWGMDLHVTRDVLVPRPETELVVEQALEFARTRRVTRLLDVGTGSGCLAVALAVELPAARIVATDRSAAALAVAARNARQHNVAGRIFMVRTNLLDGTCGPFDLIVSNPPYVSTGASLPPEVAAYEPASALFAGADGLDVLRLVISSALARLAPDGRFIVEFGLGQRDAVESLARAAGWARIAFADDLQQIPRVAIMDRAVNPDPER